MSEDLDHKQRVESGYDGEASTYDDRVGRRMLDHMDILLRDVTLPESPTVLDVLLQAEPEHTTARQLRIRLLETLIEQDNCLMSRNAYVYFIEQDQAFLRSNGVLQEDT